MLELRRDLDFTKESLRTQNRRQLRPQHLHRDLAVVFEIFRCTRSAKRLDTTPFNSGWGRPYA